jgi:transcriptional regulator with XRE-family HTH domain
MNILDCTHTQTDHHLLNGKARIDSTAAEINKINTPKTSVVLRDLLLTHRLRPYHLSKALNIPNQTIHQLLHKNDLYPKISTLIPIAKFFKITISQLIGEEHLDAKKQTEDEELEALYAPGVWNHELFAQCTQCVVKLLEKYNMSPNDKLATKLVCDTYAFSLRRTQSALDEVFADWQVSQYASTIRK